jgi:hypothetical protein
MASVKYDKFKAVIIEPDPTEPRAIQAKYQGDQVDDDDDLRKLWPLVLGFDTAGEEVALCYQYKGYSQLPLKPHVSMRNLRCLKISKLTDVTKIVYDPATEGFDPPVLRFKQVKKQTCVDDVDVYRQPK